MIKRLVILVVLLLLTREMKAGLLYFSSRVYTPYAGTEVELGEPSAITNAGVNPRTGDFVDGLVRNRLVFGVDPFYQSYFGTSSNVVITVLVNRWDVNDDPLSDTTIELHLNYNPFTTGDYVDMETVDFGGAAYEITAEITAITVNSVSETILPAHLYLEAGVFVERYFDFLGEAPEMEELENPLANLDCNGTGGEDVLHIIWEDVAGAEEYQLEWLHINDYGQTTGSFIPQEYLNYNFRLNSTRITTQNNHYDLSLIFERGFLVYRVRAIGVHTDEPQKWKIGEWNLAESGTLDDVDSGHKYFINETLFHEMKLNWQYQATYAEEGKKKEVVSYYDGTMRGRQTVTKINSDSTTVVGETIYDHQGRPAITVLPVPVPNPACSAAVSQSMIRFYPKFNIYAEDTAYTRIHFDLDADTCVAQAQPMDTASGASRYYSPANGEQDDWQAFVPDALKYPFAQVEYTADNTGRIRSQSGVGETFQLGNGHETKYYYSQPNQLELDRAFGVEVGYAQHYKKNTVIDPNGQTSISYLDQEGRVIMTALAADSPENVEGIPSESDSVKTLTINAFGNENTQNEITREEDGFTMNTMLNVAYASTYSFTYGLTISPMQDTCVTDLCMDCVYDLVLSLRDDCGVELLEDGMDTITGRFTILEGGAYSFHATCGETPEDYTDTLEQSVYLTAGSYQLSKSLRINEAAREAYITAYLSDTIAACAKTLDDFLTEELENLSTVDCEIDCSNCYERLGTLESFLAAGNGSEQDYYLKRDDCAKLCGDVKSPCEYGYDQLLVDMSPGGQYAEYFEPLDYEVNPTVHALSVFNEENELPNNITASTGNWRHPVYKDKLGTHTEYRDENGLRSKILVSEVDGVWKPSIIDDDINLIQTDSVSGDQYIYPEQLANVSDFINYFQASWARSLVYHHPEWCYYETCRVFAEKIEESDPLTSAEFDILLLGTADWATAYTLKLVASDNSVDWFNTSPTDPDQPFDAWVAYDDALETTDCAIDYGQQIQDRFNAYAVDGMTSYSAMQLAAYMAKSAEASEDSLITVDYDPSTLSGTDQKDIYWQSLKGIYLAIKQEILDKRADCIALNTCHAFNDCFDNDGFSPWASGMTATSNPFTTPNPYFESPYFDALQPCGKEHRRLYNDKIPRFAQNYKVDAKVDMEESMYVETGKCPVNFHFESLLSSLAAGQYLDTTDYSLAGNPFFQGLYYNEQGELSSYDTIPEVLYNMTVSGVNPNRMDGTWTLDSVAYAEMILKKEELPVIAWDDILMITCLECGGITDEEGNPVMLDETTPAGFRAQGIYLDSNGRQQQIELVGSIDRYDELCNTCEFAPHCEPNKLSMDLTQAMNLMLVEGTLDNTSPTDMVDALEDHLTVSGGTLDFHTLWGAAGVLNVANDLKWSATAYGYVMQIRTGADALVSEMQLHYTSFEPGTYDLSDLADVINFEEFIPQTDGTFSQYITLTGDIRIQAFGKLERLVDTDTTALTVGVCEPAYSVSCSTPAHENYREMQHFIREILLEQTYDASGFSPLQTSWFNGGIQNSFPMNSSFNADYNFYQNNTTFTNNLQIWGDTDGISSFDKSIECGITIYNNGDAFPVALPFSALTEVEDFYLYKSDHPFNYDHIISMTGIYELNGMEYRNKLFVSSTCINMNSCASISFDNDHVSYDDDVISTTETNVTLCPPNTGTEEVLDCKQPYLDYVNCVAAFNRWAVDEEYPYSIRQLLNFDQFVSGLYCVCYDQEDYCGLLEAFETSPLTYLSQAEFDAEMLLTTLCNSVPEGAPQNCLPPFASHEDSLTNSCIEMLTNQATISAQERYAEYSDSLRFSLMERYNSHCMGVTEMMNYTYTDKMYHFTLYYYDQAGNLIKTIPPEGVSLLDITSSYDTLALRIADDRKYSRQTVFTNHRLESRYEYNSLGQLTGQKVPDADPISLLEVNLANGLHPKLQGVQVQMLNENIGFLAGKVAVVLHGTTVNRGYLYRTDDGAKTWKRVSSMTGAGLRKIQMLTDTLGFAIGEYGTLLRTLDGGSNWDMLHTWGVGGNGMIHHLNDFHFVYSSGTYIGMLVGENTTVIRTVVTPATATALSYTSLTGNLPAGVSVTAVSSDGTNFYLALHKTVNDMEEACVYRRTVSSTSGNWTTDGNFRAGELNDIQFLDQYSAYMSGEDGRLYYNADASSTSSTTNFWAQVPSNSTLPIKQIAFFDRNEGVSLQQSGGELKLYRTTDAAQTWIQVSDASYKKLQISPDQLVIAAVGEASTVDLIVPQGATVAFESIQVPLSETDLNFTSVWLDHNVISATESEVALMVIDDAGTLHYTPNALRSIPQWYSSDQSSLFGATTITDAEAKNYTTTVSGALRASDSKLYFFDVDPTGVFHVQVASGQPTPPNYSELTLDGNYIYGWNNLGASNMGTPAVITLAATAATSALADGPATASVTAVPAVKLAARNNRLVAMNANGQIYTMTYNPGTNTLSSESNRLWLIRPTVIRDLVYASSTMWAAGSDGLMLKRATSGGNPWEPQKTGFNNDINNLYHDGTKFWTAGSEGLLRSGTISAVAFYNSSYASDAIELTNGQPVEQYLADEDLYGMDIRSGRIYATGTNGLVLYCAASGTSDQFEALHAGDQTLYSVSFKPSSAIAYMAGPQGVLYEYSGKSYLAKKDLHPYALRDVHFADVNHGTILGDNWLLRVTHDGGNTWVIQRPPSVSIPTSNMTKVWTYSANLSFAVGFKQYALQNNIAAEITSPAAMTVSGRALCVDAHPDLPFLHVGFFEQTNYNRIYRLDIGGSPGSYSFAFNALTDVYGTQIQEVHVFPNADFASTHTQGRFNYYRYDAGLGTPHSPLFTKNLGSGITLIDMDFHDQINGVLVSSQGAYYSTQSVQVNSEGYLTDTEFAPVRSDIPQNDPYIPSGSAIIAYTALACINKDEVAFTGAYLSTSNPTYAATRRVYDPISKMSSRFWYDRLGRLILSQNSRQYETNNDTRPRKYSYTLYDALGRVTEVGEKSENTDTLFASIFGAAAFGAYNPQLIDDNKLADWIAGDGERREVTHSYYDKQRITGLPVEFIQNDQTSRKRIVHVSYESLWDGDDQTYDHATHYSYDIHGNVQSLLQDNRKLSEDHPALADEQYKQVEYNYDLISGNVQTVSVQRGKNDQWHHAYEYDADNRITDVHTTTRTPILASWASASALHSELVANSDWETDARYFYYAHGPLARTELGENNIQGLDYIYNLQGWLKGVNSTSLDINRDPGLDAVSLGNYSFSRDVTGFNLDYFTGDYSPISSAKTGIWAPAAGIAGSDLTANSSSLYNGNIRSMQTTLTNPTTRDILPLGNAYQYDQLQRLKKSRSFVNMDLVDNVWENDGTYDSMYYNAFSYDANGNILTQERYNEAGTHIEDLVYQYERNSSNQIIRNRLYHVNDSIGSGVTAGDIDDQGTFYETDVSHNINEDNNYQYDQEGRLAKDIQEGIDTIVWRVDGKIALIEKSDTTITFDYDAIGNRIAKHVYGTSGMLLKRSTYYLLDAQGNTMNVYNYVVDYIEESTNYELSERHIYGSSRLGMVNQTADPTASVESSWSHLSGKKAYELSNHLGNVLTTVTDKKIPLDENTDDAVDGYLADILSATDYSPFGVELDGRNFASSAYRYSFQGQEGDDEIKGEGNSINYKYRMHDPRLGRFFALDPLSKEYPWNSPYAFSENKVIMFIELEGLEVYGCDLFFNPFVLFANLTVQKKSSMNAPAIAFVVNNGGVQILIERPMFQSEINSIPQVARNTKIPNVRSPQSISGLGIVDLDRTIDQKNAASGQYFSRTELTVNGTPENGTIPIAPGSLLPPNTISASITGAIDNTGVQTISIPIQNGAQNATFTFNELAVPNPFTITNQNGAPIAAGGGALGATINTTNFAIPVGTTTLNFTFNTTVLGAGGSTGSGDGFTGDLILSGPINSAQNINGNTISSGLTKASVSSLYVESNPTSSGAKPINGQ